MEGGEEERAEGGAGGRGEVGPEEGVVVLAGQMAAEEDGAHGSGFRVGGRVEELGQFENKRVRVGLLAQVEQRLRR